MPTTTTTTTAREHSRLLHLVLPEGEVEEVPDDAVGGPARLVEERGPLAAWVGELQVREHCGDACTLGSYFTLNSACPCCFAADV
eukprot:7334979-Alexandrium_andersonii.AAC.1